MSRPVRREELERYIGFRLMDNMGNGYRYLSVNNQGDPVVAIVADGRCSVKKLRGGQELEVPIPDTIQIVLDHSPLRTERIVYQL